MIAFVRHCKRNLESLIEWMTSHSFWPLFTGERNFTSFIWLICLIWLNFSACNWTFSSHLWMLNMLYWLMNIFSSFFHHLALNFVFSLLSFGLSRWTLQLSYILNAIASIILIPILIIRQINGLILASTLWLWIGAHEIIILLSTRSIILLPDA